MHTSLPCLDFTNQVNSSSSGAREQKHEAGDKGGCYLTRSHIVQLSRRWKQKQNSVGKILSQNGGKDMEAFYPVLALGEKRGNSSA
jgi:hypothetical protein